METVFALSIEYKCRKKKASDFCFTVESVPNEVLGKGIMIKSLITKKLIVLS